MSQAVKPYSLLAVLFGRKVHKGNTRKPLAKGGLETMVKLKLCLKETKG